MNRRTAILSGIVSWFAWLIGRRSVAAPDQWIGSLLIGPEIAELNAWQKYCFATGRNIDPAEVKSVIALMGVDGWAIHSMDCTRSKKWDASYSKVIVIDPSTPDDHFMTVAIRFWKLNHLPRTSLPGDPEYLPTGMNQDAAFHFYKTGK